MATEEHAIAPAPPALGRPEVVADRPDERPRGWTAWLTTTDHKRVGVMFMVAAFAFLLLGGVEALLMRLQLARPDATLIEAQVYNGLVSMHGTTMIFLFAVPMIAGLATYMVPLMVGARGPAFPRLNALAFWLFVAGGLSLYASLFFVPPTAGWTSYPPLSGEAYLPWGGVDAWILTVWLTGLAAVLVAINFVATIHNMRAPGMGPGRMPLFVWTVLVYSYLLIVAVPVAIAAATMLLTDRHFGTGFFDPAGGGDPLIWQHLIWFFGHPAAYLAVLPAFGIVSEILPVFARKPIFGYRTMVAATVALGCLGLLVWGQHLFTTPTETLVFSLFTISALALALPIGIKVFGWIATLWRGSIVAKTPLYFAAAVPALFTVAWLAGVAMAIFPLSWQLQDSHFEVAQLHYALVGGGVFGLFAGIHYWFPKITGRLLSEGLGKLSFWAMLAGINVTFLAQFSAGLSGMPRRVYQYPDAAGWGGYNLVSTVGAFLLALGVLLVAVNVVRSLRSGKRTGNDPWHGNTLEWFVPSPPPENDFDAIPRVESAEPMRDIRREVARAAEPAGTVAQPVT